MGKIFILVYKCVDKSNNDIIVFKTKNIKKKKYEKRYIWKSNSKPK